MTFFPIFYEEKDKVSFINAAEVASVAYQKEKMTIKLRDGSFHVLEETLDIENVLSLLSTLSLVTPQQMQGHIANAFGWDGGQS